VKIASAVVILAVACRGIGDIETSPPKFSASGRLGAAQTTQPKPVQLQDALHMSKPHLDLLALAAWA